MTGDIPLGYRFKFQEHCKLLLVFLSSISISISTLTRDVDAAIRSSFMSIKQLREIPMGSPRMGVLNTGGV